LLFRVGNTKVLSVKKKTTKDLRINRSINFPLGFRVLLASKTLLSLGGDLQACKSQIPENV
jgi:hypothetical protein